MKAYDYRSFVEQICIFQEMKKWNIFIRILQLQGSKKYENRKPVEKLNISSDSPPMLSTRIWHYFVSRQFVEIISSMWGVDPPTNRASVNSVDVLRGSLTTVYFVEMWRRISKTVANEFLWFFMHVLLVVEQNFYL